jgi:hypothetical protein
VEHTFDGEETGGRGMRLSSIRRALHRPWHWVVAALILGELVVRGPVRALRESRDLTVHFAAARVWVEGGNPYDMRQVGDAFEAGGGPRALRPTDAWMPSVYPPVTLALEAPLALLRWRAAVLVFAAGSFALAVLAVLQLARRAGLTGGRAAIAVLGSLAMAPLQTGLGAGQVAIPSAALLLLGWSLRDEKPGAAGVLVALGAALKPTLAVPLLLACALRPSARLIAAAAATFGALLAVGVGWLEAGGHHWLVDWLGAVRAAASPAGMNYVRPEASGSVPMIHLDMLLWRITSSPVAVVTLSAAATVPVAAFAAWRLRCARGRGVELLALAALCVASLLAMYHRTYDAFLLAVPLAAVLACWDRTTGPLRVALGACFAMFLVPGAPLLQWLERVGAVPTWLSGSATWRILLVPHQIWALLVLELLLVMLLARRPAPTGTGDASRAHGC